MIDTASIVICSLIVVYIAYAALRLDIRERKTGRGFQLEKPSDPPIS
ncbi:MAG TPA: hypothetical protein VHU18_11725 [Rhizomicrobium sp.]|jgi:hypothetical protein|nr:hypothetical protein [Rhizomicrobium sp.]